METTALEYTLFRFIAMNTKLFSNVNRVTRFKLSDVLIVTLKKTAIKEKTHTKEQLKRNIDMGIATGQISVMRLDLNSKTKYKHIQRILK